VSDTLPAVSVIIPCFNRGDLLQRALRSVLAQSCADIEVIVGDDGSTEDLRAVVAAFDDSRLRVVRREVNGGIGAGRNVAVHAARAPLLSFLDSDDEWLPNLLDVQRAAMDQDPEIDACTTSYEIHYVSGRREIRRPRPERDLLQRVVRRPDLSAGSTMMIRAASWRSVGPWREDIRRYEDYEWFLRFALAGQRLEIVDEVAAVIHSNDRAPLDVDQSARSIERILALHGDAIRARSPGAARALRATFQQELAWAHWRCRAWLPFVLHLSLAVALDPGPRLGALSRAAQARVAWRRSSALVERR
jgi:glycosyltransferase involved in cell wall biosynthesis